MWSESENFPLTSFCGQNLQWVDPLDHHIFIHNIQSVQHIQARKGKEHNS